MSIRLAPRQRFNASSELVVREKEPFWTTKEMKAVKKQGKNRLIGRSQDEMINRLL
jgi:hypothetical protein